MNHEWRKVPEWHFDMTRYMDMYETYPSNHKHPVHPYVMVMQRRSDQTWVARRSYSAYLHDLPGVITPEEAKAVADTLIRMGEL